MLLSDFMAYSYFHISPAFNSLQWNSNLHCASVVPESTATAPEFASLPFLPFQNGYYDGGDRILDPNPSEYSSNKHNLLSFHTQNVYTTNAEGVFKFEGNLHFYNSYHFGHGRTYGHSFFSPLRTGDDSALSFSLKGFWSKSSGKLCMVGSGTSYSPEGNLLHHPAVLKLNGVKDSSNITSLVAGTLRSVSSADDPNYFDPISLLILPETNYQYTMFSKELENKCSGEISVPAENLSLRLQVSSTICSILKRRVNEFELEYASDCNSSTSCNPFGDAVGYLPQVMSLNTIQCSKEGQRLRFLMEFPNSSDVGYYRSFNPETTFVAEGSWDWKKNRLCVAACRILNTHDSLDNSSVEDCSIRLTLRFPAIWSIRASTSMSGQIWSNRALNDTGYFGRILFQSTDNEVLKVPGLKYEYTEMEKVRNMSCLQKKPLRNSLEKYPDGFSQEMNFGISVKISGGKIAWGHALPIAVDDQISPLSESFISWSSSSTTSSVESNISSSKPLNISYKISFRPYYYLKLGGLESLFNISSSWERRVAIYAEGIYDSETGVLCMVGCRDAGLKYQKSSNNSMDCEISIRLQFPPLNAMTKGGFIRGRITSLRNKSDSLYFEPLFVSATSYYRILERRSIWRMDLELLMVLISKTLACIFVVFQLLYVKKHRDVLPFISLLMLVILTLGHMNLLVLNFEALFFQNEYPHSVLLRSGGWLEVHEVIVRVVTMVAFLLHCRLLQHSLSRRMRDNSLKALWTAEKKALFLTVPVYLAGALIALFVNWRTSKTGIMAQSFLYNNHQHSLWGNLRSYAGLILDGFLLPQILLNIFHNSRENALSRFFYIGLTVVRLVPHAYDIYRAQNYVQEFDGSYIYADPAADIYSTGWDVAILFVGLLFAAIIHFQQQFGGRCLLPRRFRELEVYEKIPEASEE
ncbi:DUF2921 family protein [Citrus sinensis]|nr:DUF2921 family protein [Citrus sinensis]